MRLGKALDNETRVACRKLHRVEWGKTLTLEQYLEREDRLASHPWSQKALTSWVLTGSDGELLSQLETYRMEATCPGHDRTTAFGIASVFTEEKHRGKGYASKLVGLLLEQLRQESGDAVAVVLYSDVGPGLYAKAGGFIAPLDRPHSYFFRRWQPADSVARCQLAGPVPPPSSSGEPGAGVGAGAGGGASDGEQSGCLEEWLAATGVVLLTRAEALEAADQLAEEARHACKQTGGVAVIPTSGQVDWLLHREATYCHLLGRQPLPFHGARHERCVAVWMGDFATKPPGMKILLFKAGEPASNPLATASTIGPECADSCQETLRGAGKSREDAAVGSNDGHSSALVAMAAVVYAEAQGLTGGGIEMWEEGVLGQKGCWPPTEAQQQQRGLRVDTKEREGSLPMMAVLHKEEEAAALDPKSWSYVPRAVWC